MSALASGGSRYLKGRAPAMTSAKCANPALDSVRLKASKSIVDAKRHVRAGPYWGQVVRFLFVAFVLTST